MRRILTIITVAAMFLPGQSLLAVSADQSPTDAVAAVELAVDELRVNINTDDAATLAAALDGIGLKRAQAIVAYREANGPFQTPGELAEVKGIGTRTVNANASRIEVQLP